MKDNNNKPATINLANVTDDALAIVSRGRMAACDLARRELADMIAKKDLRKARATLDELTARNLDPDAPEVKAARAHVYKCEDAANKSAADLKTARDYAKTCTDSIIDMGTVCNHSIYVDNDKPGFDPVVLFSRMGCIVGNPENIDKKSYKKTIEPLERFFNRSYSYIKAGKVCVSTRTIKTSPKEWLIGFADVFLANNVFMTTDNDGVARNPEVMARIASK